jgi:hypothetical protein
MIPRYTKAFNGIAVDLAIKQAEYTDLKFYIRSISD